MTIDPTVIRCDCGLMVQVIDRVAGQFTCSNRACKNFGKVFQAKPVPGVARRVHSAGPKPDLTDSHGHTI